MPGIDRGLAPEAAVRRSEVTNGATGRRRWSPDDRARILKETLEPGAVISSVARRHGLTSRSCSPGGAVRVMAATKSMNFRKGAEGWPRSCAIYAFRAGRADRINLICWEGTGVYLFAKRPEDGKFQWPGIADGIVRPTCGRHQDGRFS